MAKQKRKQPRASVEVRAQKRPALPPATADPYQQNLIFRFGAVDREGPWCLSKITPEDHLVLLERISSLESMPVRDVFSSKVGKDYETHTLPNKQAQDRLVELGLDDQPTISSIRITGERRILGFRADPHLHVLWWDPHHEVWPSTLKHT